jgi:uncharacterized protein (DUF488 family)
MVLHIVYTIGYDLRGFEEFLDILRAYSIERVIDVRRWVKSRRLPEYSYENLVERLPSNGIDYVWIPELGGYRRFGVDVEDYGIASCFKSEGFRAYATYITMNPSVKPYLEKLVRLASEKKSVIMCREKLPWRCHRKILSDYLLAKGFKVVHIIDRDRVYEHKLHKCAKIIDRELTYT